MNFNTAYNKINSKFAYLTLLEFSEYNGSAKFLDKEFGEFNAKCFRNVLRGKKSHPERSKINKKEKTKKTNLEKYGTEFTFQSKKVKDKIKKTNLDRYGVENPAKNKDIYGKVKKTNINRYGAENPALNKDVQKKIKETNLERYGGNAPISNTQVKEKIKITNLKRYGVENVFASDTIKEKIKKITLEKYGVEYLPQLLEIKNKINETNIQNGNCYNINGESLAEYYRNSNLSDKVTYTCVQKNYKKYGKNALEIMHYNELFRKSRISNIWLCQIEKNIGSYLIREYHIPNTLYHADGYDPNTNTIYEFYGDFWHGNLNKFPAEEINPITKTSFQELYNKTIIRQKLISDLGYNFVYIWESDF